MIKDGERNAYGEAILAAGAVKSRQSLELSGIGEPTILGEHDIPVNVNLPSVGENRQDRVLSYLSYKIAGDQMCGDSLRDPELL